MTRCPSDDELGLFADGGLADEEIVRIGEHLEGCSRCREVLDQTHPIIHLPRAARSRSFASEAGLRAAKHRIASLDPSSASITQNWSETTAELRPPGTDANGHLGAYRIVRRLGGGGMGTVYEAEDTQLRRRVALKVMKPHMAADDSAKRRFLREARAAAGIRDDRVVTIHHVGEENGTPFLVMEFLEGETLGARLRRDKRLPVADAVQIGIAVSDGLAAAHAHGLIHRDVKPDNIWLLLSSEVKLLDFGLARSVRGDPDITLDGTVVGTPSYMAPEQARAESNVDHRSDLFGLGCVLYRACTGEVPFPGADTVSMLMALATTEPIAPRQLNPDVSPELSTLILRLLAKDAAARPESAAVVAESLRAIANPAPVQRSRLPYLVAALVILVASVGCWYALREEEPAHVEATPSPVPDVPPLGPPAAPVTGFDLLFDRERSVVVPNLSLEALDTCTIEFTCSPEAADYAASTHLVGVPRQCSLFINPSGRLWGFGVRADDKHYNIAATAPTPSERTHVAGVRASKSLRVFVGGKLAAESGCSPSGNQVSPASFHIGPGFVGRIDEIRISKSARYDANFTPAARLEADADTLALYHCDEGKGDVLIDSSGHERHGTIRNAKWVPTESNPR